MAADSLELRQSRSCHKTWDETRPWFIFTARRAGPWSVFTPDAQRLSTGPSLIGVVLAL
jgi:hypothetical protein